MSLPTRASPWLLLLAPLTLAHCTRPSELRRRIAGLEKIAQQAELNGAVRCAPRELAIARSQLEFASIELDQGFASKAHAHLDLAEQNARAADYLSPAVYCAKKAAFEPGDRHDPDSDGDGIADSLDQCALSAEDKDGLLDEDGCPEPDNDLDGLLDAVDRCPNVPEDMDGYADDDGCPDLDNDHDAVPDAQDQCPNEIGPSSSEPLGCPSNPLVVVTDCEVKITQQIHFESSTDKIRSESFPVLDAVADVLGKNPNISLEIRGHTDNKGAPAYNKELSDRRAHSVMSYLTSRGVGAARLTAIGFGMERPLVDNGSEATRALNRRVQFFRSEANRERCPEPAAP